MFIPRNGTKKEFDLYSSDKNKLKKGEIFFITDTKELCFCFEDGNCELLKFSEEVGKDKAELMIKLINKFYSDNAKRK